VTTGNDQSLETQILKVLRALLGFGLILLVFLNVANAAGRYGGLPILSGMDELLVFGMIWIVMIGAILATRDRSHLSINLLPLALGPTKRRLLETLTTLVTAGVCGFVAWYSWVFIDRIAAIGQTSMGLGIPMVIPHLAILVGFSGIAIVSVLLGWSDLRAIGRGDVE
jgi:TRAP-type transport system small permease protein